MVSLVSFLIGLVLALVIGGVLWWIIFTLAGPLWEGVNVKIITAAKVIVALIFLLGFIFWLQGGMYLPFLRR